MDPFSAIGAVASILTFVDFGYKAIAATRQIHQSARGATADNANLESITSKLQSLAIDLEPRAPGVARTSDEIRLDGLARECQDISTELLMLLNSFKPKVPKSKRHSARTLLRSLRNKDEKDGLEARLDKCRQQLHLQLSQTTRLEISAQLGIIQNSGECQAEQLKFLACHIEALNNSINATNIGPDLAKDIASLRSCSQAALDTVIQGTILAALVQDMVNVREDRISEAYESTFGWLLDESVESEEMMREQNGDGIFDLIDARENDRNRLKARDSFVSWLTQGSGIFHISGKPGAGKSTLMKYISSHPRTREYLEAWVNNNQLVIAKFFFWKHGTEDERSFQGLLRCLLHSILHQCQGLVRAAFPKQWDMAEQGIPLRIDHGQVKTAFESLVLNNESPPKHKLFLLIDGLDEFEGRDDVLVRCLFDWVRSGNDYIKICVSSRELPIFQERFSACPKFRLHELTQPDVLSFVQKTLRRNDEVKDSNDLESFVKLGTLIAERAEGVFLWVALALRTLEDGLVSGDTVAELRKKVDYLPSQVEDLFDVIFAAIQKSHPVDRRRAMGVFAILVGKIGNHYSKPECSLLELSFLCQFFEDKNFVSKISGPESLDDTVARLKRCQKQIDFSCRGMVTVTSPSSGKYGPYKKQRVALTHRSLVEFLARPKIKDKIDIEIGDFNLFQFHGQSLVAGLKTCASQLPNSDEGWPDDFQNGFRFEIHGYFASYFEYRDSRMEDLWTTLTALEMFGLDSIGAGIYCTYGYPIGFEWEDGYAQGIFLKSIQLHTSTLPFITATYFGIHEVWVSPESTHRIRAELDVRFLLSIFLPSYNYGFYKGTSDRFLRAFALLLGNGLLPHERLLFETEFRNRETLVTPTTWQLILWHNIISSSHSIPPQLLFSLFLSYGADPNFWLKFEPVHGKKDCEHLICVIGLFGMGKKAIYSPLFIKKESNGILALARYKGGLVSLRDLVEYWFPHGAEKIQKLIDQSILNGQRPQALEEGRRLAAENGFDIASWVPSECETPKSLLGNWIGESKMLKKDFVDSDGGLKIPIPETPEVDPMVLLNQLKAVLGGASTRRMDEGSESK
ncbi:hypothetical protein B0J13DRAFT_63435 [Dactylonectria estremocensis]|uniref:Nephrocystin 3-like N-terminal domain-containing protein n=1 Tax=Dactylonectria estremocensis TaxID=1079267 RepID=A0A9P9IYD4_9HYPO|nr:hypothetical protein B0J13DRAFT_63435 [Dactylonectria estremocensis]